MPFIEIQFQIHILVLLHIQLNYVQSILMPLFGPVYIRKRFRGKEGPASHSGQLERAKLTRLTEPRAENSARAFSDCLAFTEKPGWASLSDNAMQ